MKSALLRQLIALPLLLAGALLYACSPASGKATSGRDNAPMASIPPFSATYVLAAGDSVSIAPTSAPGGATPAGPVPGAPVLRLERVNDSRCRTGAVCVWAGYISYSFTLTNPDGTSSSFVLAEDMPSGVSSISYQGISYALAGGQPAAPPHKDAPPPDYRVSLHVSNIAAPPAAQ